MSNKTGTADIPIDVSGFGSSFTFKYTYGQSGRTAESIISRTYDVAAISNKKHGYRPVKQQLCSESLAFWSHGCMLFSPGSRKSACVLV